MKKWMTKATIVLTVILLIFAVSIVSVLAEEENADSLVLGSFYTETESISLDVDTDRAAEEFVQRLMNPIKTRAVSLKGNELTGANRNLYFKLLPDIRNVANGVNESTIFTYSFEEIYPQTSFTKQELNVTEFYTERYENNQLTYVLTTETNAALQEKIKELNISIVTKYLLQDCSYDLYWYDKSKTGGSTIGYSWSWSCDDESISIEGTITFKMKVSQDYRKGDYQVDSVTYGQAARAAADNGLAIMSRHESEDSYQRLLSYKNEICNLTSYNDDAADENTSTPYGNPWQVVWVFDNNPDTKVVCEGYSKAFKYLNDLSAHNEVKVILAEGTMGGGTGEGPHMWNIVRMDNNCNYLVDVTNCDEGTAGAPDALFMAVYAETCQGYDDQGNVYPGYIFQANNTQISYIYNGNTLALFSKEEWTLSNVNYTPPVAVVTGEVIPNDGKWNLLISGDGKMPDYAAAADVPWSADVAGKTIDRVVLSEGLTHIGSNAFAMLNDGVRIDFLQTAKPTVAEGAFGNIQAVCRYYSTDTSWSGTTSTTNVTWIDLPAAMANNDAPQELRYRVNSSTSKGEWAIGERTNSYNSNIPIRADQAKEITYNDRWVVFEAIPTTSVTTAATDKAVYEGLDAPTVLLFMEDTNGTYTVDFTGKPANLRMVESRSMNPLNLTITAPAGNQLEEMVICDGGVITYTGDIDKVTLKTTQWQTPATTINGNVGELTYYDAASDSPFKGTLTVNGTIAHGTVHSQTSLYVPGISATNEPVAFDNFPTSTFENVVRQTAPVITLIDVPGDNGETHKESRLNIGNETTQPTAISLGQFRMSYFIYADRIAFDLMPKESAGLGTYSASIPNILISKYNPGFTTADIIQGPDTIVYVEDTGTGENDPTIVLGNAETGNTQTGVQTMYLQNCKVKVNWPVNFIMVWQFSYVGGPVQLEINSQVNNMGMFLNQGGGRISVGSNGYLKGGYVNRGIRGNRYFGAVTAGGIVAENGTLCQMSWRQGETTKALLASDATVTAAAGNQVASGQFASMDVADATLTGLTPDEQTALNSYLTNQELDADHVISVFDVSVSTYERDATNDNLTRKETLSELTDPVSITIANNAGETAKVVRLHEGTSGVQANELENKTETVGVYEFETNLFSKYALVAEEIPLTEKQLITGNPQLTWYAGLQPRRSNEPGRYGTNAIGYFAIPDSEQITENDPGWSLRCLNGTDCFELYGFEGEQKMRELRPKTENLTPGTSSQYEVSCQVGNSIYRATTTITIAQTEGIPTGIQLQKASFNPETAATGSTWTDVGEETDLADGDAIAIRAQYIGTGLGDIEDQVLNCLYYGGNNSFIDTPSRQNYEDAAGNMLLGYNVQPILAVSTGMDTVGFGILISGTNLQYYAKTDIYVNRSQVKSFTAPVITIGKTQYYEGEAFTISCPWITGAASIDMIIWKENDDALTAYSVWAEETETCVLQLNNVDPFEDRRLTAGQYHVQIVPWAAGYKPASYSIAFEIISLPDFTTFKIPEGTTEIGAEAFAGIAAKNVRIPDECTTIGANAFANSQLENIFIPASVTSIGDNAFPTETTVFMTQENAMAASLRMKQCTVIIIPAGIDAGQE